MEDSYKREFWMMINVMMELMGKPRLSREAIVVWWNILSKYEFHVVHAAIDKWVDTETRPPTPAQIKEMCKPEIEVFKSLPNKKSREGQAQMAKNVADFIRERVKPHERDWVRHWESILENPDKHEMHNIESAKRALVNLGKPWKGIPTKATD
jgi:hypothetical protein